MFYVIIAQKILSKIMQVTGDTVKPTATEN